ncbi:hypothetical protein COOONC_27582 [Cooperia oncophora]
MKVKKDSHLRNTDRLIEAFVQAPHHEQFMNLPLQQCSTRPNLIKASYPTSVKQKNGHRMIVGSQPTLTSQCGLRLKARLIKLSSWTKCPSKEASSSSVVNAIPAVGLFEAARLASPILPQYHPKQLIVLLNAGRNRCVRAILLHVLTALKQRQITTRNQLSHATSIRLLTVDATNGRSIEDGEQEKRLEEDCPEYYEIDEIPPLPLHSLFSGDTEHRLDSNEKGESIMGVLDRFFRKDGCIL